ncbi:MAG: sigma-70 family RNA polymerase sigma factor [Gemmataceae bacterium]
MAEGPPADLLERWRSGDEQAAAELFDRYAERLVRLARSRLPANLNRRLDPEDVVQSVYRSFFAEARAGNYELQRGSDLWRLLVTITLHKLYNQVKRNTNGKRAVGREQPGLAEDDYTCFISREPTPAEAAELTDALKQIMGGLETPQRRILELRLQGYSVDEIADEVGCSQRSVLRNLQQIKGQLHQGLP